MKWFQHHSNARNDPAIQTVIAEYGMEAYACFWVILEVVAQNITRGSTDFSISLPLRSWCAETHQTKRKLVAILEFFDSLQLIRIRVSKNLIEIAVPKLLKYCDNDTKNLQATSKLLASRGEERRLEDTSPPLPPLQIVSEDSLWNTLFERESQDSVSASSSQNTAISTVIQKWQSCAFLQRSRNPEIHKAAISGALRKFKLRDILTAIERYNLVSGNVSKDYRSVYRWTLGEFLSRRNGYNVDRLSLPDGEWQRAFWEFPSAGKGRTGKRRAESVAYLRSLARTERGNGGNPQDNHGEGGAGGARPVPSGGEGHDGGPPEKFPLLKPDSWDRT